MGWGDFSGIVTALLLLLFIGLVAWAWSSKRKADFDAAARLPLEGDDDAPPRDSGGGDAGSNGSGGDSGTAAQNGSGKGS